MTRAVELFTKEANKQRLSKDVILEKKLELLKEEHLVGCLVDILNMLKYCNENREKCKNVRHMSQGKKLKGHDPQVDL